MCPSASSAPQVPLKWHAIGPQLVHNWPTIRTARFQRPCLHFCKLLKRAPPANPPKKKKKKSTAACGAACRAARSGWVVFPPLPLPFVQGCGPVVCAMAYALTLMTHSLLLVQIQLFYYTFGSWFFLHDAISSEIEAAYAVGGLPPVRNSAAMVSKCEKTICKSLTVWPLWWLAWIAGKAGAWSTVWHHLGRLYNPSASSIASVSVTRCVVSTPLLCTSVRVSTKVGKWLPLPSCADILQPLARFANSALLVYMFVLRCVVSTPLMCTSFFLFAKVGKWLPLPSCADILQQPAPLASSALWVCRFVLRCVVSTPLLNKRVRVVAKVESHVLHSWSACTLCLL